ncbi:MAG: AMIN domain-containing protein [Acidobacteriia bacterium]|nr:AMIN domain-containing protein [Terriglobia bacterium]
MSSRRRRTLAGLPVLILLITASVAATAIIRPQASTAAGPLIVERIDVIRGGGGVEIEITTSGPMQFTTMQLSKPERFVVDVPDSIPSPELSATHSIAVDTAEIKSVHIDHGYQQGIPVTRIIVEVAPKRDMEVALAPDGLKLRLRIAEQTVSPRAAPAATGGFWARIRHRSPKVDELEHGTATGATETNEGEGKLEHDTLAVTAEPAGSATPPGPVQVEGVISRSPALSAGMAPVAAPPLESAVEPSGSAPQPEPVNVEGIISGQPALSAVMVPVVAPPLETTVAEAKLEPDAAAVAAVPGTNPVAPPAPLGVGVTGKAKDAELGSEENAIRATLPAEKRFPARRNGGAYGLQLSGAVTGGYYEASTSNGYVSQEDSPVGSLRLDASGFVRSPGFLNFTVKPQGSMGRQSSEGVFPDGDGVSATTTLFGSGATPFTVSYHRLNRKVVTFGPLDRLAGLEASTFQDSLGASWQLHLKNVPELAVSYSKYSDSYEPLTALAPKTADVGRLFSADLTYKWSGWNLQSSYKSEHSSQDLINIFDPTQAPFLYQRNNQEGRVSADREFGEWLSTSIVAGATKSRNEVQGRPFDQSFRFLTGSSFLRPSKKLTFSFRAGVTDNIVGAFLEQVTGGNSLTSTQPILLVPSQADLRLINVTGSALYAFTNDLRAQADVTRETTQAPPSNTIASTASGLTSAQGSLAFTHRFRRWRLQSYYAANGGNFTYAAATGSSQSYGQRANASATIGSLASMELTAGVNGSLQNVTGSTFVHDRSAGANLALSRSLWERWKVRATYDRENDKYKFLAAQFSSALNGISVAVVHPIAELSISHNIRDGLTFQADPRLQLVSSGQGGLLLGAFPGTLVVPTGATWSSAALVVHPVQKLTGRVAWLNSRQSLQSAVTNSYREWEASAGYRFRSITMDVGYLSHDQNFAVDVFKRNRFFFRVVREFTVF